MEQKYQRRICQQEFFHEGRSQSACQIFSALKRNLLKCNSLSMKLLPVPRARAQEWPHWVHQCWSQCLPQTDRNPQWVEEAALEGQDGELNSTAAPGNRTCVKGEADGRSWHRLSCSWKQHCQHWARAKGRSRTLRHFQVTAASGDQQENVQCLSRSLHKTAQPHQCCKGAETECAQFYTHTLCRKETLYEWFAVITEVGEENQVGERTLTSVGGSPRNTILPKLNFFSQ